MFITKNHPVFLTLFLLIVTVFVLTPAVSATSHASGGVSRRREHATLKRFVKKRAVAPASSSTPSSDSNLAGIPLVGAAPDPSDIDTVNTTTSTSTSLTSTSTTDTATISSSTNTTTSTSLTTESTTSTSANATSTTSSSSSSSTSSTSSQTSQTSSSASAVETPVTPSSTQVTLVQTKTAISAAETSVAPSEGSGGLTSGGKTALVTVLIVIAASVGGIAILWTVFRKWKLGRSKKFDQRLQPISWEPTVDDDPLPHRPGSDSASFRSESRSGYGATSNLSHGLDHDFTAGAAHLAPVGGYADLTRGPSPQPSMQETLSRGPSLTRPNYDASVPLHHQNNYGVQDTYGRY